QSPPGRANPVGFLSGTSLYIGFGNEGNHYFSDLWVLDTQHMVWREIPTPLSPRTSAFSAAIEVQTCTRTEEECQDWASETCMLMFGGSVATDVIGETWLFTPSSETFTRVPDTDTTPQAAAKGCAVGAGTKVYTYGGYGGSDEDGILIGNDVLHAFDTKTMTWSSVWSSPSEEEGVYIQSLGCYMDDTDGFFYTVFGQDILTGSVYESFRSLNLTSCLAGTDTKWVEELNDPEQARHSLSIVYDYWDEAYGFGGWADDIKNDMLWVYPSSEVDGYEADIYEMNPSYDGGPATGLVDTACATSGDSIYAFGGQTGAGTVLNTLLAFNSTATCYDMCIDKWRETGMGECDVACDDAWYACTDCAYTYQDCVAEVEGTDPEQACMDSYIACFSVLDDVVSPCQSEREECGTALDDACYELYEACYDSTPGALCTEALYTCYDANPDDEGECDAAYDECSAATPAGVCDNSYWDCYYEAETAEEEDGCEATYQTCYATTPPALCDASLETCYADTSACDAAYTACISTPPDCDVNYDTCDLPCEDETGGCEEVCDPDGYPPEPMYWTRPTLIGSIPAARHSASMVAFGPVLMVFGGQNAEGILLDDEFTYHTGIKEIKAQESVGDKPCARSGAAVVAVGETLILFGGMGDEGVLGDMYTFSYFDKVWTKLHHVRYSALPALSDASLFFIPIGEAEREGTYSLDDGYLYLQGGVGANMLCQSQLYKVYIDIEGAEVYIESVEQTMGEDDDVSTVNTAFASAPVSVLGNRALSTGGRNNRMSVPPGVIRVLDFTHINEEDGGWMSHARASEIQPEGGTTMERNRMGFLQGIVGTSLYTMGGYLVESASAPKGQPVPEVWTTVLGAPCDPSADTPADGCYPCARGSVYAPEQLADEAAGIEYAPASCQACPKGHFAAHDGMAACTACPEGFYNDVTHGDSRLFCLACPSGTYNPDRGQAQCTPCPPGDHCPVACVTPSPASVDTDLVTTVTPKEYYQLDANKDTFTDAARLQRYLYIGLGALMASVLLAVILGKRTLMKALDLFSVPYVFTMPAALGSKKTWIGGMLSGLFICTFVVIGGGLVIPYLFTNITEDRSLVPLCLATTELTGTLSVDLDLVGSFETCATPEGACAEAVTVTPPPGVDTGSIVQTCSQPSGDTTSCSLHLEVPHAQLLTRQTEYTFTFTGSGEYFASTIGWRVESGASNPGQTSSIEGLLLPDASMTFRGTAVPTEIGVFSTESMYLTAYEPEVPAMDTDTEEWNDNRNPSTGRIFEFIGYERGSMVNNQNFWDQNGVSLTLVLERSENILSWRLSQVQDIAAFLAALLGSMTGLQGTFAVVAGVLRTVWGMVKDRWGKDVFTKGTKSTKTKMTKAKGKAPPQSDARVYPVSATYVNPLTRVPGREGGDGAMPL
ncbi:hypothetical protein KIPB_003743, partial [Kipferlia bialata]